MNPGLFSLKKMLGNPFLLGSWSLKGGLPPLQADCTDDHGQEDQGTTQGVLWCKNFTPEGPGKNTCKDRLHGKDQRNLDRGGAFLCF